MKKTDIMKIAITIVIISFGSTTYAEFNKEGSGNYIGGKSGTLTMMKMGEGRLQINWDELGVLVEAPDNSPFVNASFRSIGTIHSINGKSEGSGAIVFTCTNGDQIFGVLSFGGAHMRGPTRGIVKFIGGTGKCSGIEGQIQLKTRPKVVPSKKGTYQHLAIGEINWKLP